MTHREISLNPESRNVSLFRLENLNTEWMTGPYNSTQNPFGRVVRCQDCHMSLFPYGQESTYEVGELEVTSPTPGQFPLNFAAVPGVSTDLNYPLQQRQVVTHYMTGVDVPILRTDELRAHLGQDYPDVSEPGVDEYGIPLSLAQRREDLLKASVRINLDKSDRTAQLGRPLMVKVAAVALTGHRFPAGFSQERTAYIQLSVRDNKGFLIYQSGYVVDKPHSEVGEMAPDGNLDDEDPEHLHAVVDPGRPAAVYRVGNRLGAPLESGKRCRSLRHLCHTHVSPAVRRGGDCAACHQVMRPLSHTPRWRDASHGKHAALDRQACAVCHTADTCSRCHNQVSRSHLPLGLFKAGAHADLATLQLRSCFTCHTFEDTCAACHLP